MSSSIGGFFGLELNRNHSTIHKDALAVNSGRNAFELILRELKPSTVYLPFYSCDALLKPLKKLEISYSFYHIDEAFYPKVKSLSENEWLLYVNYFGIMDDLTKKVVNNFDKVILDNSQSFFSLPNNDTPAFNSPRKFFGVPDGGYLYNVSDAHFLKLEQDYSAERFNHLINRIDVSPEFAFQKYLENEAYIDTLEPKKISKISKRILDSIDYDAIKKQRIENYNFLNSELASLNRLSEEVLALDSNDVPLVYPFLADNGKKMRELLITKKIYTAQYWPNVESWLTNNDNFEYKLISDLIPLPIDQRYGIQQMKEVVGLIKEII